MERENKKRKSREKIRNKKDDHQLFKTSKKFEFNCSNNIDYNCSNNANHHHLHGHRQRHLISKRTNKEGNNIDHRGYKWDDDYLYVTSSLSSSSSSSNSYRDGIFNFPWLNDEDHVMFKANDVDQCTTNFEEIIKQQTFASSSAYNYYSYLFDDYGNHIFSSTIFGGRISLITNDVDDHMFKSDSCLFKVDRDDEFERMEYYIWSSVFDQPLDTGFNTLL